MKEKTSSMALGITPGSDLFPVRVKVFPDLFRSKKWRKVSETSSTFAQNEERERIERKWGKNDSRGLPVSENDSVESLHGRSVQSYDQRISSSEKKRGKKKKRERRETRPTHLT